MAKSTIQIVFFGKIISGLPDARKFVQIFQNSLRELAALRTAQMSPRGRDFRIHTFFFVLKKIHTEFTVIP